MWEEGLTEPLAEQTRPKALTEIIGQEKAIRALRVALCGPNPQHVLVYGPPGVGKTAARSRCIGLDRYALYGVAETTE